jgi:hypothetical protein
MHEAVEGLIALGPAAAAALIGLKATAAKPRGRAVQVTPMKPTLKAPGYMRLQLKCDDPKVSTVKTCFKFQLAPLPRGVYFATSGEKGVVRVWRVGSAKPIAEVWRCRLNPRLSPSQPQVDPRLNPA